jgi:glycosyl hydrolase group 75 (putative chitosanase)
VINGGQLVAQLLAIASQSKCTGANIVSAHSYQQEGGNGTANICKLNGAVYYESGMNIDCDGLADSCMPQHCPSDDPTNQSQTSYTDANGQYLSAGLIPYIVIPQDFTYPGVDQNVGGNVVAVIYNNQLEFTVWGDQGPSDIIGEASYATANNLGLPPDPATGGAGSPTVTYIVFAGTDAVPQNLADPLEAWQLGMSLAQQLVSNNP